jgi:hypothetical protein
VYLSASALTYVKGYLAAWKTKVKSAPYYTTKPSTCLAHLIALVDCGLWDILRGPFRKAKRVIAIDRIIVRERVKIGWIPKVVPCSRSLSKGQVRQRIPVKPPLQTGFIKALAAALTQQP